MGTQSRIPTKDADFSNYTNIAVPYLNVNKDRLVLTPTAQSSLVTVTSLLTSANTGWNTLYPASFNPAVSTESIIASKKRIRKEMEKLIREIYNDIPRSILTQEDSDTLNIPLQSTSRTSSGIPTSIPSITITSRGHLTINISILDVERSRALSNVEDAEFIELESAFLEPGATVATGFPSDKDFHHVATLSKSSTSRSYTVDQLQGKEYLKARYINSRGEQGNWSEVVIVAVS